MESRICCLLFVCCSAPELSRWNGRNPWLGCTGGSLLLHPASNCQIRHALVLLELLSLLRSQWRHVPTWGPPVRLDPATDAFLRKTPPNQGIHDKRHRARGFFDPLVRVPPRSRVHGAYHQQPCWNRGKDAFEFWNLNSSKTHVLISRHRSQARIFTLHAAIDVGCGDDRELKIGAFLNLNTQMDLWMDEKMPPIGSVLTSFSNCSWERFTWFKI